MNKARIVGVVWVMSGRPHRRKTRQRRNEAVPLLCVRTSTSSRSCAGRRSTRWIVSGRVCILPAKQRVCSHSGQIWFVPITERAQRRKRGAVR